MRSDRSAASPALLPRLFRATLSRLFIWLLLALAANLAADIAQADDKSLTRTPVDALKLPVTRDTWFSAVGDEANCNLGGSDKLKVKSIQEISLIDVDTKPLVGRTIQAAKLHLYGRDLERITVGSFGAQWVEGTAPTYEPQIGSSSFRSARHPDVPWTKNGGDLCSVILGNGGTLWRMAEASTPDAAGWQHVPVDPAVVAARVAGISEGFLVFDDTGTTWHREGEKLSRKLFPNRFFKSHESGSATAPYLTVELGAADHDPPAAVSDFRSDAADLPAGEAIVSWPTPADQGPAGSAAAGTVGFFVTLDGTDLPRAAIPLAKAPGERVSLHLRDLDLPPGGTVTLAVRAVDGAGNLSPAATTKVKLSAIERGPLPGEAAIDDPPAISKTEQSKSAWPKLGQCQVAIIDALDKVQPVTGQLIPAQPEGYLTANHLWRAADKTIRLSGARNEHVEFQILLRGPIEGLQAELKFNEPGLRVAFSRYVHVASASGPLPDPLLPLAEPFAVPSPDEKIAGQRSGSLLCEIYLPHDTKPGDHQATLKLTSPAGNLELAVVLTAWNFSLPDRLSFLPEMNCYGLPADEQAYYRLAHDHRTIVNRVPYHHNGQVEEGCAPRWDGERLDWSAWDKRFGPLLDGSAFADSERGAVPLECFYLPVFENWPVPIDPNYNGSYWADRAFKPGYREALVSACRQIAQHCDERGWHQTLFQFFMNGKIDFKERGWSRGSCPWLLDEPANFQDYWALAWYGRAIHDGIRQAGGQARMVFRIDISRPEWQRDVLDNVLDYNVVGGGSFRQYRRIVLDRQRATGQIVVDYGSSNAVEQSNMQPVGWAIDSWSLGSDGIVPWQTIGSPESWQQANAESLLYPPRSGSGQPRPSIRLKAYRRGEQDVEYLTLARAQFKQPRWALGQAVREQLHLAGRREGTGFVGGEDAGVITFADLLPQQTAALRHRLGRALSAAHPADKPQWVEFRTPPRAAALPSPGYVFGYEHDPENDPAHGSPDNPAAALPAEKPAGRTVVVQGRPAVRDALIDFGEPDRQFGGERRSNALRRGDRTNAFLVRFDLAQAGLPPQAKLRRARLRFFVWDPSSQGNTKLVAARVKTAWEEATACWNRPATGKTWASGAFDPAGDTADPSPAIIVRPEQGGDTADPPVEYECDVTAAAQAWLAGAAANEGLAILPLVDRAIDDGQFSRFQIYASEYAPANQTPQLVLELD